MPCARGFLVSAASHDLPGEEKAANILVHQRQVQAGAVDAIVFDGVSRPHDARVFQPGHGGQGPLLHVQRHGGGKAGHVHLVGVAPLRLDEQLVAVFVRELDDFVLDAGAIAHAGGLYHTGIHRAPVQIVAQYLVRLLRGITQIAWILRKALEHGGIG